MIDDWRAFLYPLGFLSALAFSGRMLLQWLSSEYKRDSVVMPAFWKLSLCGNVLLALHALIQVQFHVCCIQVCNAVIAWRNLNLMQPLSQQSSMKHTISLLIIAVCGAAVLFALQGHFLLGNHLDWFRIPTTPWRDNSKTSLPWMWHLMGFVGLAIFSSRFWLQWWCAEKQHKSYLGGAFWWFSLVGEGLCLLYFLRIKDPVNFIGPACSMIPYIRNLMLIRKKKIAVVE